MKKNHIGWINLPTRVLKGLMHHKNCYNLISETDYIQYTLTNWHKDIENDLV